MSSHANGAVPHAIVVNFNPETHGVNLVFDNTHFKTWDMVLGVLEMAKGAAQDNKRLAQMVAMQQQAQQAAQDAQIRGRIMRG